MPSNYFMCLLWGRGQVYFLQYTYPIDPVIFIEKPTSPLLTLLHQVTLYVCVCSGHSNLLIFLFVYSCTNIFLIITVASQYAFISSNVSPPTLCFFCFKIVLAILGTMHFHISLKFSLLISTKNTLRFYLGLHCIYRNSQRINILTIVSLFFIYISILFIFLIVSFLN